MNVEPNRKRISVLNTPGLWIGFNDYFRKDWQGGEVRSRLEESGADINLLRELALWTVHPLAKDEGIAKSNRGKRLQLSLENALKSQKQSRLSEISDTGVGGNRYDEAEHVKALALLKQTKIFDTRRLGSNWNGIYLILMRAYIGRFTGWSDGEVLTAITHLISAVQKTLAQRSSPTLRMLVQKAIRHFERIPQNKTIKMLVAEAARNDRQLYRMFPPMSGAPPHTHLG